jgi:hypothetical protein
MQPKRQFTKQSRSVFIRLSGIIIMHINIDSFLRQPNECQVLTEKYLSQQIMI